ncbi:hypothetical protein Tco_1342467, partial [Tanacetum coccineum]
QSIMSTKRSKRRTKIPIRFEDSVCELKKKKNKQKDVDDEFADEGLRSRDEVNNVVCDGATKGNTGGCGVDVGIGKEGRGEGTNSMEGVCENAQGKIYTVNNTLSKANEVSGEKDDVNIPVNTANKNVNNSQESEHIMGDMNVTLNTNEHTMGGSYLTADMEEFADCVNKVELTDLCSMMHIPNFFLTLLQYHSPGMVDYPTKRVEKMRNMVKEKQRLLDLNPHNSTIKEAMVMTLQDYHEAISDEENFLFQKAKIEWLSVGDQNTAFFYRMIKGRVNKNKIEAVCDVMGNRYEGTEIAEQFVKHFKLFLGTEHVVKSLDLSSEL